MASVRVRIDDFEDGVLPGVCAGTGAPAARLYHVTATSRTPGWAWLALLAGPAGILFVLLAGAFGLFLWANPPGSVGLTLDSTGRWVEVDTCSGAFAFAYEQQEAGRRAARRAEAERHAAELR